MQTRNTYKLTRGILTDGIGRRRQYVLCPVDSVEYAGGRYLHAGVLGVCDSGVRLVVEATTRSRLDCTLVWRVTGPEYASASEAHQAARRHLSLVSGAHRCSDPQTTARIAEAGVR